MLQLQIWKLVNWKVQVIDSCDCGKCEPEIYFDEDVKYGDEISMRKTTKQAIDCLDELLTTKTT